MKKVYLASWLFLGTSLFGFTQNYSLKIARAKYKGGGDWYANPTSLSNLAKFCNKNLNTSIDPNISDVDLGSSEMFRYPFIHMTGHGNVVLNPSEVEVIRKYLIGGGFLHIDDNYGMDLFVRREIKKVFPELNFELIPANHPIYHQKYQFNGLPKIHEHDGKPAQGFGLFYQGRLVCFYSAECDLGDGWEDQSVHNDSPEIRLKALQMGANLLQFVFQGQ